MRPAITTADAVVLAGRRWLTESRPRAAVVLVHGFTGSADADDSVAVAEHLHSHGLDVVSYDARGHGRSGGESTLGDLERHDVAAAVDVAKTRTDRVVLVGASMGAIAVLRHAAVDPSVAGVVSVSSPARWKLPLTMTGVFSALLTRTPVGRSAAARWLGVRIAATWSNPEPPEALVRRIESPLVIIHGTGDRFISSNEASALYEEASDPSRLVLVEGMGHAFNEAGHYAILQGVDWALDHNAASLDLR